MSKSKLTDPAFASITRDLRSLATPLAGLAADPRNARSHDQQSVDAIAASLTRYGQRKPIVVNRNGNTIQAGHGTVEAARLLGWSHIAAVFVDDDEATHVGFALADNRSAELSEWNQERLEALLADYNLAETEPDLFDAMLFDELLTAEAEAAAEKPAVEASEKPEAAVEEVFAVAVICADEGGQKILYNRMVADGYKCKLMTI